MACLVTLANLFLSIFFNVCGHQPCCMGSKHGSVRYQLDFGGHNRRYVGIQFLYVVFHFRACQIILKQLLVAWLVAWYDVGSWECNCLPFFQIKIPNTGVIQLFSHLQNASLNALSTVETLLTGKCKGKCIALTIYGNPNTFSSAFSLSGNF